MPHDQPHSSRQAVPSPNTCGLEEAFHRAYEHSPLAVAVLDDREAVCFLNSRFTTLTGYTYKDISTAQEWFQAFFPDEQQRESAHDICTGSLAKNPGLTAELPVRCKDGTTKTIRFNRASTPDRLTIVTMEDMTEAKQLDDRFRHLVETIVDWSWEVDAEGRFTYASPQVQDILGYEPSEILGKRPYDLMAEEEKERVGPVFMELVRNRLPIVALEKVNRHKNGHLVVLESSGTPILDEHGAFSGYRGVDRDATLRKRAMEALKESEERYRLLYNHTPVMLHSIDADGCIVNVSDFWLERMGYTRAEVIGKRSIDFLSAESQQYAREVALPDFFRTGKSVDVPYRMVTKSGGIIDVLLSATAERDEEGAMVRSLAVSVDVTERKKTEFKLHLFEKVFENALEGISITDPDGSIVAVNPAFTTITGYAPEEVVGKNPRVLKSEQHTPEFYKNMWDSLNTTGAWEGEIWNRRKDGEAFPEWLSISSIKDAFGRVTHYAAVFHDISELKKQEERITHQAYHDALTGLPNRELFLDRLGLAISRAQRTKGQVAVFSMDLDAFKHINESLGHVAGDAVLREVANRFSGVMRKGDTVARMGSDEFMAMTETLGDVQSVVQVAERLRSALELPFAVDGQELFTTTSLGVALFPSDGAEAEELLRNATLAMHRSKEDGKNRYQLFTPEMDAKARVRLALEHDLRRAIAHEELFMVYQPKVAAVDGRPKGMEALVRWARGKEIVPPDQFIPLAEETGLILPLGDLVMRLSCERAKRLADAGKALPVAVNVSPRQFQQPDFVEAVQRILQRTGLAPELLEIEITETVLATEIGTSVRKLLELEDMGVRLSCDDFGTGYSSLNYLKHFPLHSLKIDRSFIVGLGRERGDEDIVRTIIQLAHNFGHEVVAEGVETEEQLEHLRRLGCDVIQGYYFSKPLSPSELVRYLDTHGA